LFLGVIDVLQLMYEQVVHGLDVFGEESHCGRPSFEEHAGAGLYPGLKYASCSMLMGANQPAKRMFLRPRKRRDGTDRTAKSARGTDLVATQNR
jgi:hypothetical protein